MTNRKKLILIAILIAVGFFIYIFNLNNSLFWDDDEWIKGNLFVHSFSYLKEIFTQNVEAGFGLSSNYYRPLLLLSFVFNYAIHGVQPLGYHLLNNGFHIANGVLIFILLSQFLSSRASFIASLLFLIHPVQTEAVAYISGRGDPMSVFFMLLAIWLFVKSFPPAADQPKAENFKTSKFKLYRSLSIISVILALLSRETAALFPLFLIVFYISFIAGEKFIPALKKSFIVSLPFWLISGIYFVLRLTIFNFENTLNFYSQSNIYSENLFYRLFTFGHTLIEYFKIIFYPVGLHMERDLAVATSIFQWPVISALIFVFGILYLVFKFYPKEKIWLFTWTWFFVALGPVSGIIPINALIYEHWLYAPIIGLAVLSGFYIDKLFQLTANRKQLTIIIYILFIGYLSFFGVQSIRRNILWGKPIEFYENILEYSPSSVRILTNLGKLHYEKGDTAKAAEFYEKAIETPDGKSFAEPYYNLGNIYRDAKKIDEAIKQYQKAIEVNPAFPFAYQNLAELYVNEKQDLASGIKVLEELKKIQPGNPRVYYNLGLIYLGIEKFDLAIENFEKGLELASGRDAEVETAIKEILNTIK